MLENIMNDLAGYGVGGIVLAYFLYNDYQDRRAFREEMRNNASRLNDHETRIVVLEQK